MDRSDVEKLKWYEYDFSNASDHLVVAFGSVRMFKRMNKGFEWRNLLKHKYNYMQYNRLFVADVRNSWWQTNYTGLDGYGPFALKKFLKEKIKESGATKTLFIGLSMGGYGAILFGCLLNATMVLSFSPQTYISEIRREQHLNEKFKGFDVDYKLTDLKNVLRNYNTGKTEYNIWYGNKNRNDTEHAKRLNIFYNVFLHEIDSSIHPVVKDSLNNGSFKKYFDKFLNL